MEEVTNLSKPKRTRRSHTRKVQMDCSINMAEARREVVNALHLHRSSSSLSSSSGNLSSNFTWKNMNRTVSAQLMESMPVPEPTWSTTAPAVLCGPVPTVEALEFEWPEYMSSSYSWWLGFLKSLDGKIGTNEVMEKSKGLDCVNLENPSSLDANDQSLFLDDWLVFPTGEDHGEQD